MVVNTAYRLDLGFLLLQDGRVRNVARLGGRSAASAMSKDLKKRGWSFVGPTTVYAFMQAMGLINDHAEGCVIRSQAQAARVAFTPPTATKAVRPPLCIHLLPGSRS